MQAIIDSAASRFYPVGNTIGKMILTVTTSRLGNNQLKVTNILIRTVINITVLIIFDFKIHFILQFN